MNKNSKNNSGKNNIPKEPFIAFETEEDFRSTISQMFEIGIKKALREAPLVQPFIPIHEVESKVGTKQLTAWIDQGLIQPITSPGRPVRIDRIQISQVSQISFI